MSPEQCEGKGLIDARSDIYSLGVVMYELLTARVPFPGEGFGEILVAHLTKEPEPPSKLNPDITPELEAIVMHAIEKDKNRRFQNMDEFGAAVADTASHFNSYKQLPGYAAPVGASGAQGPAATGQGTRPTTLSGSAAEIDASAPKKSKAPIFVGGGLVAAAGLAAGLFFLQKKPPVVPIANIAVTAAQPPGTAPPAGTTPPVGTAVTPTPTAPVVKDEILKITISGEPAGAEVVRAGKVLGAAPVEIQVKKGDPSFEVEVKKAGFVTRKLTIKSDSARELEYALREEPAAATTAVAKKSSGTTGGTRKTTHATRPEAGSHDMDLMQPSFGK